MNVFQQLARKDKTAFKAARRRLQQESRAFGEDFTRIAKAEIEDVTFMGQKPETLFRNRHFLAAIYIDERDGQGFCRLTVNRTELEQDGNWKGNITWDELMAVKRGIGMGDQWMVEVYPADEEIVHVANMRHLFLVPQPPFAFARKRIESAPAKPKGIISRIISQFRKP
jgi:hypothetical protein